MKTIKNQLDYLEQLKAGSSPAYEKLIRNVFPKAVARLGKGGVRYEDAEDIFYDALNIFIKEVKQPDFVLYKGKQPESYLMGIVNILFRRWCEKKKKMFIISVPEEELPEMELINLLPSESEQSELRIALKYAIGQLSEGCRKIILDFYFLKSSLKLIADDMGYSVVYIKVKKHRCFEKLRGFMKNALKTENRDLKN